MKAVSKHESPSISRASLNGAKLLTIFAFRFNLRRYFLGSMFSGATAFNEDIRNWNVEGVRDMVWWCGSKVFAVPIETCKRLTSTPEIEVTVMYRIPMLLSITTCAATHWRSYSREPRHSTRISPVGSLRICQSPKGEGRSACSRAPPSG